MIARRGSSMKWTQRWTLCTRSWIVPVVVVALVAMFVNAPESASSSPRVNSSRGLTVGLAVRTNYSFTAPAGAGSVAATDSAAGWVNWGIAILNQTGSQIASPEVSVDTSSTGLDLSKTFDNSIFNLKFFTNNPNDFIQSLPCPTPSATKETCPSTSVALPSSASLTVFTPSVAQTVSPGFGSSLSMGPVVNGDATATIAATLDDQRYLAGNNTISITSANDNFDVSALGQMTFTANGVSLPECSPTVSGACYVAPGSGSYHDKSGATCESVASTITQAPAVTDSGTPIQYAVSFPENEQAASGCPTGTPGVSVVAQTSSPGAKTQSPVVGCNSGTDCATTVNVADLGEVTASVGPGQGVTGFQLEPNALYIVDYQSEAGPAPPSGTVSWKAASSPSQGGTASTANDGTTVNAHGQGALTLAQWGSDPVTSPPFDASGRYFDIQTLPGSKFTTLKIKNCNLAAGDALTWWNGSQWLPVQGNPGPTYDSSGCVTVTLSNSNVSSPKLSQLSGTIFGVVNAPLVSVLRTSLVISGAAVRLTLHCARMTCRGVASVIEHGRAVVSRHGRHVEVVTTAVLASARYAIAAGHSAVASLVLTPAGRTVLAKVSRANPVRHEIQVTVKRGSPYRATAQIS